MKAVVIGTILTILLVVGGVFLLSNYKPEEPITQEVQGLAVAENNYKLGNIPISGGVVTEEYEIKNTTDNTLKLKKVATSCMCTEAKVITTERETSMFGMEMAGDKNPSINIELAPGASAKVIAEFDPAAHGPQGVGPFDRTVWLTFSDPVGIKELRFSGVVVN